MELNDWDKHVLMMAIHKCEERIEYISKCDAKEMSHYDSKEMKDLSCAIMNFKCIAEGKMDMAKAMAGH